MATTTIAPHHKKRPTPQQRVPDLDAKALGVKLKRRVSGDVRFDDGYRALYATDGSNYRQVPIGVVIPRTIHDVMETVAACREFGAPVLPRGGGTSLAGQCCNVAVVLDFTKYMNRVLEIDTRRKLARVEPGCVLDDLRETAGKYHLTFGPDPATHSHCALGGMLGNNSCGVHSLLSVNHGLGMRTSDNTHELDVFTYDGARMTVGATSPEELERIISAGGRRGKIYEQLRDLRDGYETEIRRRIPKLPRRVSGYALDELLPENHFNVARALVGSEGTCAVTLGATLHLVPRPSARTLVVLGYPDVFSAADHLMEILEFKPIGLEGIDHLLIDWLAARGQKHANLELIPPGHGWLLVEFGGDTKEHADNQARKLRDAITKGKNPPTIKIFDDQTEEEMVWKVREGGLGATAWNPGEPDNWEGFEDSAVPPERVADYLREFKKLLNKYQYKTSLYGHFGQGCIHCRIPFDLYTAQGIRRYESFMDEATDLVVRFGGSISGEHGDGQSRAQFLPKMFGEELMQAFRDFKRIWDPQWKMNPGKLIDANPMTSNLRLGTDYNPPNPETYFKYPNDKGTFARAALRCVGIGDCRKKGGQTMCPSYMVTMEEMHSTRGRARLLWEMLNGNAIKDGWRSGAVKEALDLCLSCKGCKGDCPVNVDIATYKSEFLSKFYKGRVRPRHAYAFGYVHVWSRLASLAAPVANFFSQTPGLSALTKWIGGIAQQRKVPAFAPEPFKVWFNKRAPRNLKSPPVMLFADTFNNYFHPEVARAAVEVLEHAGFHVEVPQEDMCCGRPLYDYGMLDTAARWLQDITRKLRPAIEAGTPIVVLEPSCCAVFRDELPEMFPNDLDGQRLRKNTFTLAEFLEKHAPHYEVPQLHRRAVVHRHCHHKAVMGFEADKKLFKKMGLETQILESGCCGLAGSFGFEPGEHYDVSIACGERVLLPAVRDAGRDEIILSDGFSCRTQIAQNTDREALHLAQVIQMAIHDGVHGSNGGPPEMKIIQQRRSEHRRANVKAALVVGGIAALGTAVWLIARRRRA
jgi:FAD/FMN-containing dehydrogenase/Fe-S oxidoreductase